jgi:glycosyltransferase involved in cell wall biosynthesis
MVPKISIVMPVYNREYYLGAAIESVLNQTMTDFELLVWDDGSTDQSLKIAQQYAELDPRMRVISSSHRGLAPTLKAAFAATTGTYLGSVDSDDLLAPTALEETSAVLDAHAAVGMVYTNYHVIDEHGHDHGLGKRCLMPYSQHRMLLDFMTFHFRLIRREVYEQVGGINSTFKFVEDYDLCLRLTEVTEVHHLERSLYYYRWHSTNMTKQRLEMMYWTYKASSQALKRRGLSNQYKLTMNFKGQLVLWQPKATPKSKLTA